MMKNSEWGAVAYLATSKYGKNNKIEPNKTNTYITGGILYTSNTGQSTTGNVYGIYDMSGGTWEIVASYVDNGNSSLTSNAASIVNTTNRYFKQLYNMGSTDSDEENYQTSEGIYGDAIYETSNRYENYRAWYSSLTLYPYRNTPFFIRGGEGLSSTYSSQFAFDCASGVVSDISFRPVIVAP